MINITRPDAQWLLRLLEMTEWIHSEYPELFTEEEEEALKVSGELIRSINR